MLPDSYKDSKLANFLHFKTLFPYLNFTESIWSIMSGDSPNVHRANDVFEFKDGAGGRSSPTPTTSKAVAAQAGSAAPGAGAKVVEASVLVEPSKEEENNEMSSPTLNNVSVDDGKNSDADKTLALEELSYNGKDKDKDDKRREKKKLNGDIDRLDGVWLPKEQRKKQLEEEDNDSCIVKCLYVTMQCCECTIM